MPNYGRALSWRERKQLCWRERDNGRGVCRESLAGSTDETELTFLAYTALRRRAVEVGSRGDPEEQEAEEARCGDYTGPGGTVRLLLHTLPFIPKEVDVPCQDSIQSLFRF